MSWGAFCLTRVLAVLAFVATGAAMAAGGADLRLAPAPGSRLDVESLQRGARNFVNYCVNCHSAKYMRYERLTDLDLTRAQITDNLMFGTDKIGSVMQASMSTADARAWFGAPPPDLSVEARIRGRDWLYNYFLSFYPDDKSATGWNNLVFPNVAMPHVLWQLSGPNKLVATEYANHEAAIAGAIAVKGLSKIEPGREGKWTVVAVKPDDNAPGTLSRVQYEQWVADLVNYLDYMAEPAKNKRLNLGMIVLLYLGLLFVFAYWMKLAYWKDVH